MFYFFHLFSFYFIFFFSFIACLNEVYILQNWYYGKAGVTLFEFTTFTVGIDKGRVTNDLYVCFIT